MAENVDPRNAELAAANRRIAELESTVAALMAEVAELKRRLGQNSRNSSLPPSTDRPDSPARRAQRKSGRKPGKQPGGQGFALRRTDSPDEIIDHLPDLCSGCGAGLAGARATGVLTRQITDIPATSARTTEHRLHRLRCSCGHVSTATAPTGVDRPVQYGPNLRALVCYLVVFQHIPVERAQTLICDLTGTRPSTGWISSVIGQVADLLQGSTAAVKDQLTAGPVLHCDETGLNIAGVTWWLHVACTQKLTAYHLHRSRGRVAVDEFGVLPGYRGTVVHDGLAVYDGQQYATARHAWCGAHITRELHAANENVPTQDWPTAALEAYHALNNAAHHARDTGATAIDPADRDALTINFTQAVLVGLAQNPRRPGREQSKTRNLLERLHNHQDRVLLFSQDLKVPFTNNQAERDVRPAKTQIKISGSHRSETGATAWLTIRAHISTLRKHQHNVLDGLRTAILGNPWQPATGH